MTIGYNKSLFILPFDHRSSFLRDMLGVVGEATSDDINQVKDLKYLIYEGFKLGVELGIPKNEAAILVDEEFGDQILQEAKQLGYHFCLSTEKSGQEEFTLAYGDDFVQHIEKYKPTFVKALIRYNPEGDKKLNIRQQSKLKDLSDWCHKNDYKFLIEPLVPAMSEQLSLVGDSQERYDNELRPGLEVGMIKELQNAGVEVDIWKIEGFVDSTSYVRVVEQAKSGGRSNVGVIVLGRGQNKEQVGKWVRAGAQTNGVTGFAIGRTVFWQPLVDFRSGKISRELAARQIAENYFSFYNIFISE